MGSNWITRFVPWQFFWQINVFGIGRWVVAVVVVGGKWLIESMLERLFQSMRWLMQTNSSRHPPRLNNEGGDRAGGLRQQRRRLWGGRAGDIGADGRWRMRGTRTCHWQSAIIRFSVWSASTVFEFLSFLFFFVGWLALIRVDCLLAISVCLCVCVCVCVCACVIVGYLDRVGYWIARRCWISSSRLLCLKSILIRVVGWKVTFYFYLYIYIIFFLPPRSRVLLSSLLPPWLSSPFRLSSIIYFLLISILNIYVVADYWLRLLAVYRPANVIPDSLDSC